MDPVATLTGRLQWKWDMRLRRISSPLRSGNHSVYYHHAAQHHCTVQHERTGREGKLMDRTININKLKNIKTTKNLFFYGGIGLLAAVTLAALIIIIGYILANGFPHINFEFLTQEPRRMGKEGGIFSVIIGTLMVTGVGILIATPIGIAAAIYYTEYASNGKGLMIIRFFTGSWREFPHHLWIVRLRFSSFFLVWDGLSFPAGSPWP